MYNSSKFDSHTELSEDCDTLMLNKSYQKNFRIMDPNSCYGLVQEKPARTPATLTH